MAFKPPSAILQKVVRFKAIQHKDGKFLLWGIPCFISELYVFLYLYKLIEDMHGYKEISNLLFNMGYLQAERGTSMINKRFGYVKTIQDKSKLLDFNIGQSEMVGGGKFEWVRKDFKNNIFITKGISPFAEEYKRFFGIQKLPVDHFGRGQSSGVLSSMFGEEFLTIETQCMASGKPHCEFVSKPLEAWDRTDALFKSQEVKKLKSMEELGAKIKPYLNLT